MTNARKNWCRAALRKRGRKKRGCTERERGRERELLQSRLCHPLEQKKRRGSGKTEERRKLERTGGKVKIEQRMERGEEMGKQRHERIPVNERRKKEGRREGRRRCKN